MVPLTVDRPIAVDLFAGAGGMSLGFEQAGFDVLAAVEIDPIHACTHEFNFPNCTVLCKSVAETTGDEIRNLSEIGDRDIDVVFGGPPCQGFSLMGKRHLDDPRNTLIFHFLRLVSELKPKFFVMENVPGMAIGQHQVFLEQIINNFKKIGYQVEENYQILNAANYGVPQKRRRLFLLGSRPEYQLPKYPEKNKKRIFEAAKSKVSEAEISEETSDLLTRRSDMQLAFCIDRHTTKQLTPTVWDAIGDLPEVNQYPELKFRDWVRVQEEVSYAYKAPSSLSLCDSDKHLRSVYKKPSLYAMQLRNLVDLDDNYAYIRTFDRRILTCSSRTRHSLLSMQRFSETQPGKTEPISHFHKLDPKGLCNTLRAGTASNRGAFTSPRPIHPFTPRCITVREAARLHSYPDWFRFHATKWHGFRQIGNSVPPLLAKSIASEIICALEVKPIKPLVAYQLGDKKLLQFKMVGAAGYYGVDSKTIEPRIRKGNRE
ncbi:MAG: DNA cytosine methyltransferase [Xenococcaceae cyanobacterium]